MIVIKTATKTDINQFVRNLFMKNRDTLSSFEQAAGVIVEAVYNEFRQPDQQPTFALVRIYRLTRTVDLLPELKNLTSGDGQHWMALIGTIGSEQNWCDRRKSKGHRVLQLGSNQSPMLSAAISQLGLDIENPTLRTQAHESLSIAKGEQSTRYLYIKQAAGSPFIPAQQEFVVPHHIQSVVGIGSNFISQASYFMIAFSKVLLEDSDAIKFSQLSAFISTLLATYDARNQLWES